MPKSILKKLLPTPANASKYRALKSLERWAHIPSLWHLNRRSASKACFIGLFFAFVPLFPRTVLAPIFAVFFRANVPLTLASALTNNPLTAAPIYFAGYKLGVIFFDAQIQPLPNYIDPSWLFQQMTAVYVPMLLGGSILGLGFGITASVVIRISWRIHLIKKWKQRNQLRQHNPVIKHANPSSMITAPAKPANSPQ